MGKRLIGSVGLSSSGVPDDLLTTKGDTHGFSSTNARIPIGDDDDVLTADSSEALGLAWKTPSGGNASTSFVAVTDGAFESSDTTYVAITGATHTIPSIASGKCLNIFNGGVSAGAGATGLAFQMWDSGTGAQLSVIKLDTDQGHAQNYTVQGINDADGQTVYCNFKQDGGGTSTLYASSTTIMTLTAFAV